MRLSHTVHLLINSRSITGQLGNGERPLVKLDLAYLAFQANTSAKDKKINLTQLDPKETAVIFKFIASCPIQHIILNTGEFKHSV